MVVIRVLSNGISLYKNHQLQQKNKRRVIKHNSTTVMDLLYSIYIFVIYYSSTCEVIRWF